MPEEASKAWLQGVVVVECTVDGDGRVTSASAVTGDPPLTEAGVKAVRKWRFAPVVRDGRSKAFVTTVQLTFVLERRVWVPDLMVPEVIASLSSRHEAIREAAAVRLGAAFKGTPGSREKRWAEQELRNVLKRDQSQRVREAAQQALSAMSPAARLGGPPE